MLSQDKDKEDDKDSDDSSTSKKENKNFLVDSLPTVTNRGFKCVAYHANVDLNPVYCANADQSCNSKGIMLMGKMNNGEYIAIVTAEGQEKDCSLDNFGAKGETVVGKKCFTHLQEPFPDITPHGEEILPEIFSHRVCQKGDKIQAKVLKQGITIKCDEENFGISTGSCRCYKTKIPNDNSLKSFYYPIRFSSGEFQCLNDPSSSQCKYYTDEKSCKSVINTKVEPKLIKRADKILSNMIFSHFFNRFLAPKETGLEQCVRYNTDDNGKTYTVQCLGRNGEDCFVGKNAQKACDRVNTCPEGIKEFEPLECSSSKFKSVWFHNGFDTHTPTWCKNANAYFRYDGSIITTKGAKKFGLTLLPDGMSACIPDSTSVLPKCLEENEQNILQKTIKMFEDNTDNYKDLIECKGQLLLEARANENHWCSKSLVSPDSTGKFTMNITYNLQVSSGLNTNTVKEEKFGKAQSWRDNFLKITKSWDGKKHLRFMEDVNGDGLKDIVGFYNDGVYVSLNNGGNTFNEPVMWSEYYGNETEQKWDIEKHFRFLTDIDGDGKADILGIGDEGTYVSISNGEKFTDPKLMSEKFITSRFKVGVARVFIVDLNKDGKKDILCIGTDKIWAGFNKDDSFSFDQFGTEWMSWDTKKYQIWIEDFNNDGYPDIFGVHEEVYFAINNKGKNFEKAVKLTKMKFGPKYGWDIQKHPYYVVDINKDKLPDIVGFGQDRIFGYYNLGNGKFSEKEVVLLSGHFCQGTGGWSVTVDPRFIVDVNKDGYPDIVAFSNSNVQISLNEGGKNFSKDVKSWINGEYVLNNGYTNQVENPRFMIDINDNGLIDIVGFSDEGVEISYNLGNKFSEPKPVVEAFNSGVGFSEWVNNYHLRIVEDMNKDGLKDIVVFGNKNVYVALNTGSSISSPQVWFRGFTIKNGGWNNGQYPRLIKDINKDGYPDLIGFGHSAVYAQYNLDGLKFGEGTILLQGQFTYKDGWRVDKHPRDIIDVNKDGYPDIVGFANGGVYVSLNKDGKKFKKQEKWIDNYGYNNGYRVDSHFRWIVDINGDELPDIVATANDGTYVSLNSGTNFGPPKLQFKQFHRKAGWRPNTYPIYMIDINKDNLPDIVGFASKGLYVSLNEDGAFKKAGYWLENFGTIQGYTSQNDFPRYVTDLNKDGYPDIVGFFKDGVYVSLNKEGKSVEQPKKWTNEFGTNSDNGSFTSSDLREAHDMNGNGYSDIIGIKVSNILVAINDLA